ncbi:DUF4136 domain-containing protein [Calditerrivibrio nitroreducens]|uniref:DUF4136 domain-containing protein n=1 Tax=Calditerrivibrio nitroreducens TaxID=477976 RepID=UPI003C75E3CE
MRTIVTLLMTLLLSGCMMFESIMPGYVYSDISVFHNLSPTGQTLKYATLPKKSQEGSLEHKYYEQLIKTELNKLGYVETPVDDADVIVFLDYGIDIGRDVVSSYPIIGQTGISSSYTTGTIKNKGGYSTYSGTTYHTPTYGVVGSGTSSDRLYTRFLRMEFQDRSEFAAGKVKKLYEALVISEGSINQLAKVMPAMIKGLFKEFPGKSGSVYHVEVPLE